MGKFIYNVGEITTRIDEVFWIFPSDYINDEEYTICSPWFSLMAEKWRVVKDPYSEENMYYTNSSRRVPKFSKLTFRLWKKGGSSRLMEPYTIQLSLTSTKGTKMTENQNIDSDYGCAVEFLLLKDPLQTFSQNRLVKLLIIMQKMKAFENDTGGPATPLSTNDIDYSTGEETNNEDEDFREYDMNSEESDSEKIHSATECKGVQRLIQNLKRVFCDGEMCDAVLNVNGREFSVHKLILVARSSVFASMFQHDLVEKNTNVVDIPDCTAESFEIFLHYLYTGSADNISTKTVCNLYYAADKYQVEDLKEECVRFMENNISEETFCDIISLSLRHAESKLQKVATEFFCVNIKKILKTVEWQKYITENPIQANELLIKAHNS